MSGVKRPWPWLVILGVGAVTASGVYWKYHQDIGLARSHYLLTSSAAAEHVSAKIHRNFEITVGTLEAVSELLRSRRRAVRRENGWDDEQALVDHFYSSLSTTVAVDALYVVSAAGSNLPSAGGPSGHSQSSGGGPRSGKSLRVEDHVYIAHASPKAEAAEAMLLPILKNQLDWFLGGRHQIGNAEPIDIEAASGLSEDQQWLVYTVPVQDENGMTSGTISAVFHLDSIRNLIFPEPYLLGNSRHGVLLGKDEAELWRNSLAYIDNAVADPALAYSEVLELSIPDSSGRWYLWAGQPNEMYWNRGDVRIAREFLIGGALFAWFLTLALTTIYFFVRRHQDMIAQQNSELQGEVERRTVELQLALNKSNKLAAELADKESRLRSIMESVPDGILLVDEAGIIKDINKAVESILGYQYGQVVGQQIVNVLGCGEAMGGRFEEKIRRIRETGSAVFCEIECRNSVADALTLSVSANQVPLEGQTLFAIVIRDITEKVGYEKKIRDAQQWFSAIVTNIAEGIIVVNEQQCIEFVNQAAEKMLGYTEQSLLGRSMSILLPEDMRTIHERKADSFMHTGGPDVLSMGIRELTARCADGRPLPIDLGIGEIRLEDGRRLFVSVFRDISERKQTERKMKDAKENLEVLVESRTQALTQMNEQLKKARDEAVSAARTKAEFLAVMSHEIRTPFNGVLGMLSLLKDTQLDDEQRDYIDTAYGSGKALMDLLNNTLEHSKLEAGKVVLERLSFNVRNTVEDVVKLWTQAAEDKGIILVAGFSPGIPEFVWGDPTRIRQVINNFVSNAIKFTETGEVSVTVEVLDQVEAGIRLQITVSDTGIGMSEEQQRNIFDTFSQADSSITRRYGGTGLGLSICKNLVERMGGEVTVESAKEKGSKFSFVVPLGIAEKPMQGAEAANASQSSLLIVTQFPGEALDLMKSVAKLGIEPELCHENQLSASLSRIAERSPGHVCVLVVDAIDIDSGLAILAAGDAWRDRDFDLRVVCMASTGLAGDARKAFEAGAIAYLSKPVTTEEYCQCITLLATTKGTKELGLITRHRLAEMAERRPRCLVVEDNKVNQKIILAMLRKLDLDCDLAEDGRQAVEAVGRHRYSVVLMDCQMPVMDGLEATRTIRAQEDAAYRLPIIALTANVLAEEIEACFDAGMDDYVAKPVDQESLKEKISLWIDKGVTQQVKRQIGQ